MMDIVVLLILAASGLSAVSSHAGRQYYFVYDRKNMTEAQSYCREKYTDLATIDNMEDVKTLNNMADLSKMVDSEYGAWIGLYDDVNSWMWSLSDKSFYKNEEMKFRHWKKGEEPNNAYSNQHCTQVHGNGYWYNDNCTSQFKAVCMDVRELNVTFVRTNFSMNWTEAQSYCRKHHTDLVSVRNMTDNQKVKQLVPPGDRLWIGLFGDSWKWSDGSNSSFRYWIPGQPTGFNHTCAAANFRKSGKWADEECDSKKAFICYSAPTTKQVISLRVLKSSSLDLNDPAVMEDMLKQLKQRLKDQGLNDDIKLSWKKQPDGKVFHKEEKTTKKKTHIHDEL